MGAIYLNYSPTKSNLHNSYDEAARMAGYFDDDGVYQGGLPKWDDWSEDSYACETISENGMYCQTWRSER